MLGRIHICENIYSFLIQRQDKHKNGYKFCKQNVNETFKLIKRELLTFVYNREETILIT